MKPEHYLKVGDIIFWGSYYPKSHFCILIESISERFKIFSSYEGRFFINEISSSEIKYVSEGFWEHHYWD